MPPSTSSWMQRPASVMMVVISSMGPMTTASVAPTSSWTPPSALPVTSAATSALVWVPAPPATPPSLSTPASVTVPMLVNSPLTAPTARLAQFTWTSASNATSLIPARSARQGSRESPKMAYASARRRHTRMTRNYARTATSRAATTAPTPPSAQSAVQPKTGCWTTMCVCARWAVLRTTSSVWTAWLAAKSARLPPGLPSARHAMRTPTGRSMIRNCVSACLPIIWKTNNVWPVA